MPRLIEAISSPSRVSLFDPLPYHLIGIVTEHFPKQLKNQLTSSFASFEQTPFTHRSALLGRAKYGLLKLGVAIGPFRGDEARTATGSGSVPMKLTTNC